MAAEQSIPFEWIKGAELEFELSNPIYLAMRDGDGTLMTLKQAEITRDNWDTEKKAKAVSALDSLRKEYELLSDLKHPSIVECYGAEQTADAFNVFLEYIPGGSIESLVAKYGAFEEGLAKAFARSIVEGVAYLHSQRVTHNAISTNTIFVDNKGNCKIVEFSKTERSTPGTIDGSPDEAQQVNGKADIWSVGCVASRMLGGQSAGQWDDKVGHPVQPAIPMKTHYTHRSIPAYGGDLRATDAQQRRVVATGKRLSRPMLPL
ncbi:hypothetical protein FS837_003745 [Tulasnella sp. UAMH 9824]|nr:hypothetical protein FS837_003745 [Tulasnella sp. UAMH 9824]